MTQLKSPPIRRTGGTMDVYTGLLLASFLVLAAGVFLLARMNTQHSGPGNQQGSMFKIVNSQGR